MVVVKIKRVDLCKALKIMLAHILLYLSANTIHALCSGYHVMAWDRMFQVWLGRQLTKAPSP